MTRDVRSPLQTLLYRLQQVCQQLGFVPPLSCEERTEVARWLPGACRMPISSTVCVFVAAC